MQITEDRRKRVIDLYFNQHKTYVEIAQIERISPRDIHAIIKEEGARRQKYEHKQYQEELSSKAYQLFSEGKKAVEVAAILKLREPEVSKLHKEYCKLTGRDILNLIYKETNGNTWPLWRLYQQLIKKRCMSIEQVVNAVDIAINKLPYMESLYEQVKDQAEKMQRTVQRLANDIEAGKHKISALDKTAFSCEQDCKRKQGQVQELIDQKNILEKLIANIANGEDYSKLMQIVKENVKVVLSENKQIISVSFAALIQTIKADPQMVKLIQNMPSVNDGEQYKDNNNIVKYLELNENSLLGLAEKHYENLVEAFTKNAISTAVSSSSLNPTSSLPSLSSTFIGPSNQSDTYRIEEPERFHNSKGDIAE